MKQLAILFSFVLFAVSASAQKEIKAEDASKHVGDSVTLTGKIFGIRYFADSKNAPTLINIGGAFPNQLLTVVIYGEDRKNFQPSPEELLKDRTVVIKGKVELYRDRPQIVVKDPAGIQAIAPLEGKKE